MAAIAEISFNIHKRDGLLYCVHIDCVLFSLINLPSQSDESEKKKEISHFYKTFIWFPFRSTRCVCLFCNGVFMLASFLYHLLKIGIWVIIELCLINTHTQHVPLFMPSNEYNSLYDSMYCKNNKRMKITFSKRFMRKSTWTQIIFTRHGKWIAHTNHCKPIKNECSPNERV